MGGLIISISFSVSVIAGILFLYKEKILKYFGSKMLYILTMLIAIRFIIPYSIQLPDKVIFNIELPWYIPVIAFIGTVICFLWQIAKYVLIKRNVRNTARKVSSESILTQFNSVKEKLFISDDISLLISDNIHTPMLLGIYKPCIIIPDTEYSSQEIEMLIGHELIHYRSKDYMKKLFLTIVVSLQWFNPFAWMLLKEFDTSLEMLCDETVIKDKDKQYKKDYCYMLLNISENKHSYVASTSYFSSKGMLKMRINNIFSSKYKKSGTALIIASVFLLTFASSLLCSCTVATPDDVKEEMSRIEEGVNNEKNDSSDISDRNVLTTVTVSEAVADVEKVINEWNDKNGIFKFDNCNIMIPQIDKIPEYKIMLSAGVDTPQKKYAQFKEIEKNIFSKDFFKDDEIIVIPAENNGRLELSVDSYLNSDYKLSSVWAHKSAEDGQIRVIDYQPARIWYRNFNESLFFRENSPEEFDVVFNSKYLINSYNCMNPEKSKLSDEYVFANGKASVSKIISCAEREIEKIRYGTDKRINYKPLNVEIYDRGNETCAALLKFQVYYDDFPIVNIADDPDRENEIQYKANAIGDIIECYMYYSDAVGELINSCADVVFLPTGSASTEILSVEAVLELLKNKLTNNIVYDIRTIQLGYSACSENSDEISGEYVSHPFYNIDMLTTSNNIKVSIDAVTGDMNIFNNRG